MGDPFRGLVGALSVLVLLPRVDGVPVGDLAGDFLLLRLVPRAPFPGARSTALNSLHVVSA